MAKSQSNDRLNKLVEQQNDRVRKVDELTQQIEQCKAAIQQLKEEHDYTRGQINLLQELDKEAMDSKTEKVKAK